jgi:hypothetical protein
MFIFLSVKIATGISEFNRKCPPQLLIFLKTVKVLQIFIHEIMYIQWLHLMLNVLVTEALRLSRRFLFIAKKR